MNDTRINILVVLIFMHLLFDMKNIWECKQLNGKVLLVLHHIVSTYFTYGGFFTKSVVLNSVHLISAVISLYVHHAYGGVCPITIYNSKLCRYGFRDLKTLYEGVHAMFFDDASLTSQMLLVKVYYGILYLGLFYDLYVITSHIVNHNFT